MARNIIHLSDRELVMAADGELPERRRKAVSEHLEACWSCRERMRTTESAILEFVRTRNAALHDSIPPEAGPKALLRARMAELPAPVRHLAVWRMAPAAAAFFAVLGIVAIIFVRTVNAEGVKPKAHLTPGDTRPVTLEEVCRNPESEVITANIPADIRAQVFSAYGIRSHWDQFEVDYLITPDLGGVESVRNIWPQPYTAKWSARSKDKLEQRLHDLVCEGKVDLATAQHDIASDWVSAYKKYVGTRAPR